MTTSSAPSAEPSGGIPARSGSRALVEMVGINRRFGGVRALSEVNFSINPGEVHCLAGENGCGKSTLIKILSGVLAPDSGRIVLNGAPHSRLSPSLSQAAGIQVIYQDLALFPNLTVAENIVFHRHVGGLWRINHRRAIKTAAAAVLERLGISLALDALVQELPIASRQLVAICRTLASEARVIVMDEPTASLTHREADSLLTIIRELRAQGIATVLVSHRLDDMMAVGDRVTILRDGCNVGVGAIRELSREKLGALISGQTHGMIPRPRFIGQLDPVLKVENLTRGGHYQNIHLSVRPGEILGIIGRLGSGRTELALSLFGMNPPERGTVEVNGERVTFKANRAAIRAGLGYVSEDRLSLGLVMPQSIAENAIITVLRRLCGPLGLIDRRRRNDTIAEWLERLQVKTATAERPVRELSGGNQQRVVLAKWLATAPRILILDSPSVGIDVGAKAGLFRTIDELARQGLAIILITDEVEEGLSQADRILVMREGKITAEFEAGGVTEEQLRKAVHD